MFNPQTKKDESVQVLSYLTPKHILLTITKAGVAKAALPWQQILVLGFLAGCYVALGALGFVYSGGCVIGIHSGLAKLVGATVFPIALMLVVLAGGELFTSNTLCAALALLAGKIEWKGALKSLCVSYIGNFAGGVFIAYFLVYLPGVLEVDPWWSYVMNVAVNKVRQGWGSIFLKGIGANWLVCLAYWFNISSGDAVGKLIGIWWPVFLFVLVGFEHSIANMFTVPIAIFLGADVTFGEFLWYHLVPATLGNMVGGMFFVGVIQWYAFGEYAAEPIQAMTTKHVLSPRGAGSAAASPRMSAMTSPRNIALATMALASPRLRAAVLADAADIEMQYVASPTAKPAPAPGLYAAPPQQSQQPQQQQQHRSSDVIQWHPEPTATGARAT